MTGRAFIETILDFFAEYNRGMDLALEERDVWPILCSITDGYAKVGLFENMKAEDPNVPEQFTITFKNIKIYRDNDFNLCYSNLPAQPVSLPRDRGIDFVSSMRNRNNPYIICNRNSVSMISSGGKKYYEEGAVYCWKEGTRIYYDTSFDETNAPLIFMRIVSTGASSISMDEEFPVDTTLAQVVRQDVINYFLQNEKRRQDFTKDSRQDD